MRNLIHKYHILLIQKYIFSSLDPTEDEARKGNKIIIKNFLNWNSMTQGVIIFVYLTGGSETKHYFAVLQPEKGEAREDCGSPSVVPLILWSSGVPPSQRPKNKDSLDICLQKFFPMFFL